MIRIILAVSAFLLALLVGSKLRQQGEIKNENVEREEYSEREREEKKDNGPMEFLNFHRGIRTRSDESKPSYSQNYQWTELQKGKALSAKKSSSISARTQGENGVLKFTERGPGNVPGRTRGLIVDPDDATHKTWFAGSASGGIWKTTDAGNSWLWLTPNIPNLATTTLAMAPSNHQIIYAGTGEGFGLVDGVAGSGILLSTDRGQTWNLLSASAALGSINRLIVSETDPTYVVAASNSGIYLSTNQGSSWTKVFDGANRAIQDLRSTPGNFMVQYATQNGMGVLKSIDGGQTWKLSNTNMTPSGRIEIAVSPSNPNYIAASAQGSLSGNNSDLYVSTDAGVNWTLVSMTINSKTLNYLGNQGWYDNTVAFNPYNENVIYVGGIGTYQITLSSQQASSVSTYTLDQSTTSSFLSLTNFGGAGAGGILELGSVSNTDSIAIKFGPGINQLAHRFTVPLGRTSGVAVADYTYNDYVSVPFQVWDLTTNQQLMVSFRDQNRNGQFDLIYSNTTSTDATLQSREYIFINNIPYSTTKNNSIATAGGHVYQELYNIWPVLATGATWDPNSPPQARLKIIVKSTPRLSSTVNSVNQPYSGDGYGSKNDASFVHPDQHNIYPIPINSSTKTFQLLLANDGGIYLSSQSTSPGTTQNEWAKVGNGFNTSQFYGADKKPGAQEYFGGMQDNSTYFTPAGTVSNAATHFNTSSFLSGDGFEALWHSQNGNYMIGGSQYNTFARSIDGGTTWNYAFSGFPLGSGSSFPDETKFPFISKLSTSKQAPDIIYTVGADGVWKSTDFGANWVLTPISTANGWGAGYLSFANVEVSRANANIVWAGAGQFSGSRLFVSTNTGKSFSALPNPSGVTLGNITRIATHPTEPKTAYAIFSFAKTAKILRTTDLGQTWTDISGFGSGTASTNGFPDVAVYSLYVRPDNTNIIWAGTEIGIFESLDAGATWNLLTTFPAVAVWSMKGQDKEIVIATHGRGIWTAELSVDQNANFPAPSIVATGTSPKSKFVVQVSLPIVYDSVQVKIGTQTLTIKNPPSGVSNVFIFGVPKGSVPSVQLVGYVGSSPIYSPATSGYNLPLQVYQQKFYDYFNSNTNFYLNDFKIQSFGTANFSLQSVHNYKANTDATATLLTPIIVASNGNTNITYEDVAIVTATDSVYVEGTKDGVTWKPIAKAYNAKANSIWQNTLTNKQFGDTTMRVVETFNLTKAFAATDTLLIRFRLHAANEPTTAWGWSVDNLSIQQPPTDVKSSTTVNSYSVFPNPSPSGKFNVRVSLAKPSNISVSVWDMTGRIILNDNLGLQQEGEHQYPLSLEQNGFGVYIIQLRTDHENKVMKVIKNSN